MPFLEEKIPDRPIFFEMRQQARRFLSSSMKGSQIATLIVVIVTFSIVAYAFIVSAKYINVGVTMFFLPGLIALILPGVVGSVISGEIQKRSMESLLAAPLTTRQIVVAKALRAVMPVLATWIAVMALVLLLLVGKLIYGDDSGYSFHSGWVSVTCGTVIYFFFAYSVTGICMAVSSVTRSVVASLVSSFGVVIGIYGVLPAIITPIAGAVSNGDAIPYVVALHPYGMVSFTTLSSPWVDTEAIVLMIFMLIGLALQALIGFGGIAFAANRLGEIKRKGIEG